MLIIIHIDCTKWGDFGMYTDFGAYYSYEFCARSADNIAHAHQLCSHEGGAAFILATNKSWLLSCCYDSPGDVASEKLILPLTNQIAV